VDSFRHAVGIAVAIVAGVKLLGDDVKVLLLRDCHEMEAYSGGARLSLWGTQMHIPLFLILCVAVNSQLRVDIRDWPLCVAVQSITMAALSIGESLGQGDFVSNFIPSFLAAFSSLALLRLMGGSGGQSAVSNLAYDRRDAWFCIFPSLYILIPGSGLVKACLFSIAGLFGFADAIPPGFAFVLLQIGLGQVLGIGLGLVLFQIVCRRRAGTGGTRILPV
jgi:hypothetical protein